MLPSPFQLLPQSALRSHQLDADEVIFRQGTKTRGLFFVVEGKIELRRFTEAGHGVLIHRAKSGQTFAEASLFSDHYHCDAVCTAKSQLIEMDRMTVLQKFQNDPNFALAIAKRFARQNQNYRRKVEMLTIKSAEERIYAGILDGLLTDSIRSFATEIGLTHEAVYRGLAKLVENGKLVKAGRGKFFPPGGD